jgi:tryptophan synthase beta chain
MTAYEQFLNGDLQNYKISDADIEKNLESVPQ